MHRLPAPLRRRSTLAVTAALAALSGSLLLLPDDSASAGTLETCWATHYGAEIPPGSYTSSGEIFDMNAMTAATSLSRSAQLPFGTQVKVTNTANNKSVTVRINDRGTFGSPTCLDLSDGAFSQLGAISPDPGHFDVTTEVLD